MPLVITDNADRLADFLYNQSSTMRDFTRDYSKYFKNTPDGNKRKSSLNKMADDNEKLAVLLEKNPSNAKYITAAQAGVKDYFNQITKDTENLDLFWVQVADNIVYATKLTYPHTDETLRFMAKCYDAVENKVEGVDKCEGVQFVHQYFKEKIVPVLNEDKEISPSTKPVSKETPAAAPQAPSASVAPQKQAAPQLNEYDLKAIKHGSQKITYTEQYLEQVKTSDHFYFKSSARHVDHSQLEMLKKAYANKELTTDELNNVREVFKKDIELMSIPTEPLNGYTTRTAESLISVGAPLNSLQNTLVRGYAVVIRERFPMFMDNCPNLNKIADEEIAKSAIAKAEYEAEQRNKAQTSNSFNVDALLKISDTPFGKLKSPQSETRTGTEPAAQSFPSLKLPELPENLKKSSQTEQPAGKPVSATELPLQESQKTKQVA